MRYILIILVAFYLTSCSHWNWVMKHQAEVCAKCPQETTTESTEVDTVIYGVTPPDTITIYGFNTQHDTVFVDNTQYKIIRIKGETKVIIKEKRIPITVTKYRDSLNKTRIIETKVKHIPFWAWLLMPILVLFGYYLRRFISDNMACKPKKKGKGK